MPLPVDIVKFGSLKFEIDVFLFCGINALLLTSKDFA